MGRMCPEFPQRGKDCLSYEALSIKEVEARATEIMVEF